MARNADYDVCGGSIVSTKHWTGSSTRLMLIRGWFHKSPYSLNRFCDISYSESTSPVDRIMDSRHFTAIAQHQILVLLGVVRRLRCSKRTYRIQSTAELPAHAHSRTFLGLAGSMTHANAILLQSANLSR
jgi:hypothetical protein